VRIGVLTGGGDCPGLNAVLRAIVRTAENEYGDEVIGFRDAWDGVRNRDTMTLDIESLRGSLPKGGTVLGTRRGSPYDWPEGPSLVSEILGEYAIDALIVIGGNGSLAVANELHRDHGLPIVGVPKTIDNDVEGTDVTFGFHTAVQTATDAIDRLHTTAESHDRVILVEVMGRHTGWIATYAGIAGGAAAILVPERPFDPVEICDLIRRRNSRGRYASIIVVAEGAEPRPGTMEIGPRETDRFGHVRFTGISELLAPEIEHRTGIEVRVVKIGHIQRGGTPTAFDRVLATRYGLAATAAVHDGAFGHMVALRDNEIVRVPLSVPGSRTRTLDTALFDAVALPFFS
jgi:6-phosphofructokinase 1